MNEVYEYRREPGKGVIWLSAIAVILLITFVAFTGADHLTWLVWALGAATAFWMLIPRAVSGIRVDDNHLVLSAWSDPRVIPLDDIAYLQASEASAETEMAIVYKDGSTEGIFIGDLPDTDTLVTVMATRGIAVRGVF